MSIQNSFDFLAQGWQDDDDTPMTYRFGERERETAFSCTPAAILPKTNAFACGAAGFVDPDGLNMLVTDFAVALEANAVLAAGCERDSYEVVTTCDIRDGYGGTTSATDRVTVRPYATSASVEEDATNLLGQAAASGDVQQQFQLVDAFSVAVNDQSSLGRRRRRLAEGLGGQPVRDLTTWTVLQNRTLITSDCGATRSLSIKWP